MKLCKASLSYITLQAMWSNVYLCRLLSGLSFTNCQVLDSTENKPQRNLIKVVFVYQIRWSGYVRMERIGNTLILWYTRTISDKIMSVTEFNPESSCSENYQISAKGLNIICLLATYYQKYRILDSKQMDWFFVVILRSEHTETDRVFDKIFKRTKSLLYILFIPNAKSSGFDLYKPWIDCIQIIPQSRKILKSILFCIIETYMYFIVVIGVV